MIKVELKRMFLSWKFYGAIFIILFGAIVTYIRNYSLANLNILNTVGTLNMFIYSNIQTNNVMILLSPVIACLAYSTTIVDDIKSGIYRQLIGRTSSAQYIQVKSITAALGGFLGFFIAYVIIFLILFLIDPTESVRTEFDRTTLFGTIYDHSMFLYCCAFIGYASIFGAIYSLLGLGIGMLLPNKYYQMGIPFFVYYSIIYAVHIFPDNISNILTYFILTQTFDITQYIDPMKYVSQLLFIFLLSIILIKHSEQKLDQIGNLT